MTSWRRLGPGGLDGNICGFGSRPSTSYPQEHISAAASKLGDATPGGILAAERAMPANLTPEYLAAEREYKSAQTHVEKIEALERMLARLPKHKGTEKLQADLKRRLSQARKESQKKGGAHTVPFWVVEREGAGQVALIGPPNSGKSKLLCALTHARPEVADYPFTTRLPTPGMMTFENVQIQLVDLPPLAAEFMEPWLPRVIRAAHAAVLVLNLNDPVVRKNSVLASFAAT